VDGVEIGDAETFRDRAVAGLLGGLPRVRLPEIVGILPEGWPPPGIGNTTPLTLTSSRMPTKRKRLRRLGSWLNRPVACASDESCASPERSRSTLALLLCASAIVLAAASWGYIDPALLKLFRGR
jgi:hypothetical protein